MSNEKGSLQCLTQGSLTQGSLTQGSLTQGSLTQGSLKCLSYKVLSKKKGRGRRGTVGSLHRRFPTKLISQFYFLIEYKNALI